MAGRPRLKRNERRVLAPKDRPANNIEGELEAWHRNNPLSPEEEAELSEIEREERNAREATRRELALRRSGAPNRNAPRIRATEPVSNTHRSPNSSRRWWNRFTRKHALPSPSTNTGDIEFTGTNPMYAHARSQLEEPRLALRPAPGLQAAANAALALAPVSRGTRVRRPRVESNLPASASAPVPRPALRPAPGLQAATNAALALAPAGRGTRVRRPRVEPAPVPAPRLALRPAGPPVPGPQVAAIGTPMRPKNAKKNAKKNTKKNNINSNKKNNAKNRQTRKVGRTDCPPKNEKTRKISQQIHRVLAAYAYLKSETAKLEQLVGNTGKPVVATAGVESNPKRAMNPKPENVANARSTASDPKPA